MIAESHLALLDQLTDPAQVRLAELRQAAEDLYSEIAGLTTAVDAHGADDRQYLQHLAAEVQDAVELLAEAIQARP